MIKNSLIGSFQFLQPIFRIRIIIRILLLLFPLLAFVSGQTSDTYRLFALNTHLHGSNQVAIGAIEDGTELEKNGSFIATLDAGEIYSGSIAQHDIFSANQPIFGSTSNGGTVALSPEAIQGTQFSYANNRLDPMSLDMYCASTQDCQVTIKHPNGSNNDQTHTISAESFLYTTITSSITGKATVVLSDNPIVLSVGDAADDIMILPPNSNEIIVLHHFKSKQDLSWGILFHPFIYHFPLKL